MTRIYQWARVQFAMVLRGYEFINDTLYYFQRGHKFRDAVNLAHRVLPRKES